MNKEKHEDLHTCTAKASFVCERSRPDVQTPVAFSTTRVKEPDEDDWKKLVRMMTHFKHTKDSVLTLEADNVNVIEWFMDGSCAVHDDMKGHTGAGMTMGKGSVHDRSAKQKLNAKSSAETELVGVDDVSPQVLWTNYFVRAQGHNTCQTVAMQDNESATLLENNGKSSSSN